MTDGRRTLRLFVLTAVLAVSVKNEFFMFLLAFELLLFAAALVQVSYLAKHVHIRLVLPQRTAYHGESFTFQAELRNSCPMPVPQLMVRIAVRDFPEREPLLLCGKLMLAARETGSLCFTADSSHCGCWELSPNRVVVTDFLGLVSRRCQVDRLEQHMFFILPDAQKREISASGRGGHGGNGAGGDGMDGEGELGSKRGNSPDVSDIRTYRPGDSIKLVHWKLTARLDELIVRELSEPEGESVQIFLDLRERDGLSRTNKEAWDTFMLTVESVSKSLLKRERFHTVTWWDAPTKAKITHLVKDEESKQIMLCALLHTVTIPAGDGEITTGKEGTDGKDQITIDLSGGIVHTKAG